MPPGTTAARQTSEGLPRRTDYDDDDKNSSFLLGKVPPLQRPSTSVNRLPRPRTARVKFPFAFHRLKLLIVTIIAAVSSTVLLRSAVVVRPHFLPSGFGATILGSKGIFRHVRLPRLATAHALSFSDSSYPPPKKRSISSMSSSTNTLRTSDGTITVAPRKESIQSALVVFCHGLGDSSEGFADVAEHLAKEMPWCKFVLPTAPVNPVTLNGGMRMNSWYDIVGLDERSNERCDGIDVSRKRIEQLLHDEHEQLQLPYERMVLAGFSQGGALSLFTGLQFEHKLAGIVVLSGYLPCAKQFQITPGSESTPIFHGHGTQDMIVNFRMAEKTKELLQERGATKYTMRTYSIGHTVTMEEVGHVKDFLLSVLPDDESFRVSLKDPASMSIKELKAAIQKAGLSSKAAGFFEKAEFVKLLQEHRK